ncbi:hypothetical protein [Butyrivibrio sp. MC2013]|uniref:hypothetical protein n=1 Tax=Butyrivibrio sp. MC2013 TaxID=1280686 RepID=UPI0004181876|nr:hypothetical protein [Butyrivibrio sp. MC2013]
MDSITKLSIRHISELYFYEYYYNDQDFDISSQDLSAPHIDKARALFQNASYKDAQTEYMAAYIENPVSTEAIRGLIACCKMQGDTGGAYHYVNEIYRYSCTRAEMAAYYRDLGWYYLEMRQPRLSYALYKYSSLFEASAQADSEIAFLKEAMGDKLPEMSESQIMDLLKENEIPLTASSVSLALLVKAAGEAERSGNYRQALDCLMMVYDLTADEEISERINKCKSNIKEENN